MLFACQTDSETEKRDWDSEARLQVFTASSAGSKFLDFKSIDGAGS